jgi:solute carrier family 25 carnitine/acylcarnitine transporter 20/29
MSGILPEPGSFFAGAFSGACGVVVGQPFDLIKVRLQNSGGNDFSILKQIVKYEGFMTLWRGCGVSVFGTCFGNAISFGVVENCKSRMIKGKNEPLSTFDHAMCGAYSGISTSLIVSPTEAIRIRLQTQVSNAQRYLNTKDCFLELFKNGGILSLYRGFALTLTRDVIGDAAYFATYQTFPKLLFGGVENTEYRHFSIIMLSGGLAGIAYWTVIYPVDTIKSRVQADCVFQPKYKNGFDCLIKTLKNDGFRQLYKGYITCILRAFPFNVALVLGFEFAMKLIGRDY